jgi:hypothetical protein
MFESTGMSERAGAKRLATLMQDVHAGDRMTAHAYVEAQDLPFQRWYRFKEAFSPRFVSTAIASLGRRPNVCLDPFGGSGTTSLTCQFLGIQPVTIEVNPFLSDLIESKLHRYDVRSLMRDYVSLGRAMGSFKGTTSHLLEDAPPTFVEPGVNDRWIFDRALARRLLV